MKKLNQREHYRLTYSQTYHPFLMIDIEDYEIQDVSENGMKVKTQDDLTFMVDDSVIAIISFPDGREFDLSAQVIRSGQGYVGLQLETPLPSSVIKSEFIYLMNKPPRNN